MILIMFDFKTNLHVFLHINRKLKTHDTKQKTQTKDTNKYYRYIFRNWTNLK